jgi:putative oxidoreductase|tara:strand:- start:6394 stop:6804 length:411 start_codon:yes stop_codon:yes gene_type:complete
MINLYKIDPYLFFIGRLLLGLYFLLPGISKIPSYSQTLLLMISKGVPLDQIALLTTIFLQIFFGTLIILNRHLRISCILLFILTILINYYIHDFWNLTGDPSQGHETQNFVKNLGIAAGLLVLATKDSKNLQSKSS